MSIEIIVSEITARLSYTMDWIFKEQLGVSYKLVTKLPTDEGDSLYIYYNNEVGNLSIPNSGLLFEKDIKAQNIIVGKWDDLPTIFSQNEKQYTLPFDFFAAVFFCISRYEEYLPFSPDKYLRFPASESILMKINVLSRPIVDEWICKFGKLLEQNGIMVKHHAFEFIPTYDIDIAWRYKYKGFKRTIGGYLKDVANNDFAAVKARTMVIRGNLQDPFDSFNYKDELHAANDLKPLYFILAAAKNGPFDKHILPSKKKMMELIAHLSEHYVVGMHPSYQTNDQVNLFAQEQNTLSAITGKDINLSRQHYIKVSLPDTYRSLIGIGIDRDYSMGYGTHLGFRAGTSKPFYWYDLKDEATSPLQVFPFCFMDTTAHYELSLSSQEAFCALEKMKSCLQSVGGLLVTVFHNFSLGTDKEWNGWPEAYAEFIKNN